MLVRTETWGGDSECADQGVGEDSECADQEVGGDSARRYACTHRDLGRR